MFYRAYNETPLKGTVMRLFKNRAVQVKLVSTKNDPNQPVEASAYDDPQAIKDIASELIKELTVSACLIVAGVFVMKTASEIIVKKMTD